MTALGGHINHLYEDLDLRFRDLKSIIKGLGYADIDVYEKVDGQNLFVSWDFDKDKLKVARNKQNIKDGGLDRHGISLKFGDRPNVEGLFLGAYDVLSRVIGNLSYNMKSQIFGSIGSVWFPIEIINPELSNTIHYENKFIIFHEYFPVLFGFDGEPISHGLPRNMEMLKHAIPLMNDGLLDWSIRGPKCYPIKPIDESIIDKACNGIESIRKNSGCSDGMTIRYYLTERLKKDMQRFPFVPESIRSGLSISLVKKAGASETKRLLMSMDEQTRNHAKLMIDEEKNVILPKLLDPIEKIIHNFSSSLISFMKSEYISNHEKESARIRQEYNKCCETIRNGTNDKHKKLLINIESKIGTGIVTMEGLVFKFNDKVFKVTGSFTPINRIIATVKYENIKRIDNPTNLPLSMFIQSS